MTVKAGLYFHINNGGVTLSVEDKGYGPVVSMRASHSGHQTGRTSVGVRRAALRSIGEMFLAAADMAYSPDAPTAADLKDLPIRLIDRVADSETKGVKSQGAVLVTRMGLESLAGANAYGNQKD